MYWQQFKTFYHSLTASDKTYIFRTGTGYLFHITIALKSRNMKTERCIKRIKLHLSFQMGFRTMILTCADFYDRRVHSGTEG